MARGMKIAELTISGYRSVSPDHPCTLRFGDVTLLIGPNGAGYIYGPHQLSDLWQKNIIGGNP